jgi:DNA-binding transcriptional MerR regulator
MEKALPSIPAKRYFTIGEVSDLCAVKPYVLRYWEQEFAQLKPMKRRGNRRYYQHHEVLLIRRIRELLYDHGFTINGARNRLGDAVVPPAEPAGDLAALQQKDLSLGVGPASSEVGAEGLAANGAQEDAGREGLQPLTLPERAVAAAAGPAVMVRPSTSGTAVVPVTASSIQDLLNESGFAQQLRIELMSIRELLSA